MRWQDDTEVGSWIRDRLGGWSDGMHAVVPHGFEAYARVFHRASVRSASGPAVTTEAWRALPDDGFERLRAQTRDEPATWATTAEAFGTTLHPLAQWNRIVRTPEGEDWHHRRAPDGRLFTAPIEGDLPPEELAPVAEHLVVHTTTPDDGVAGVWEGWGGLLGGHMSTARVLLAADDDDPAAGPHAEMLARSFHDPFNNPYPKAVWQDGILSREISEGARLELPQRNHVLFAAPPRAFADPSWVLSAPWRDPSTGPGAGAEAHGLPPTAQHPSLIWPADRAWILVSEIDFDSTVVGGSAALVRALCADPRIEALPIAEGADLSWDADDVNR
ncbi:hypothetical protein [Microbacterium capsulatum]|uniref:DUF317 domain-containing protein n=1 Tax=Microbacterium capsulatum TaxID=3041921 RepID=A0ABU0XI83_9MICO|nr:hypothetical protein [Microbacterium sp. ASV81]MDQ4214831.1 hypothetical protein [Microbacterium sp. ASV81]